MWISCEERRNQGKESKNLSEAEAKDKIIEKGSPYLEDSKENLECDLISSSYQLIVQ